MRIIEMIMKDVLIIVVFVNIIIIIGAIIIIVIVMQYINGPSVDFSPEI